MNYYGARQVDPASSGPDAGLWRYTVRNDRRIWPTGYCGRFRDCPDCDGRWVVNVDGTLRTPDQVVCARCAGTGTVDVGECPGHATADEARAHYREFLLDTARFDGAYRGAQYRCVVCDAWTSRFASVGPGAIETTVLCDAHRNREALDGILATPGESISSY